MTILISCYIVVFALFQFLVFPTLKAYYVNKNPHKWFLYMTFPEDIIRDKYATFFVNLLWPGTFPIIILIYIVILIAKIINYLLINPIILVSEKISSFIQSKLK